MKRICIKIHKSNTSSVPVSANSAGKIDKPAEVYAAASGNTITISWQAIKDITDYLVCFSGKNKRVSGKTSCTFTSFRI
jgi:hypothetical protein